MADADGGQRVVNCGVTATEPSIPVPEVFNSSGVPLGLAAIETQLIAVNASLDAIEADIDAITADIDSIMSDVDAIRVATQTIATEQTAIRKYGQVDLIASGSFATGAMADLNSTAASPYVAAANYSKCYVVIVNGDYTAAGLVTLSHLGLGGTVEAWRIGDSTGVDSVGAQIQPGEERIIEIGRVKTSDKLRGKASTGNVRWALYGASE